MSTEADARVEGLHFRLASPPELWSAVFERSSTPGEKEEQESDPPLNFRLGLARLSVSRLGVELGLEVEHARFKVNVSMRAAFEVDTEGRNQEDVDRELRLLAAQIGPALLYPFVRETVSSLTAKSGIMRVVPPIVNFGSLFKIHEVQVPAP